MCGCWSYSIFLVDHAWTYRVDHARQQLEQVPGLLARMAALMEVDFHGEVPDVNTVELVMEHMWKYNQTYRLNQGVRLTWLEAFSWHYWLSMSSCHWIYIQIRKLLKCVSTCVVVCLVCRGQGSCVVHHGWVWLQSAAFRQAKLWHGSVLLHSESAGLLATLAAARPAEGR